MKGEVLNIDVDVSPMNELNAGRACINKMSLSNIRSQKPGSPSLWCIGGGKGGIGKSFISSSMGLLLAKESKRVLLVDADFGAANLHTFIKCEQRMHSFSRFLKRAGTDVRDVICKTALANVDLISGANDVLDAADLKENTVNRLVRELRKLDYDYILIDAGPGTASHMLDLFLMSHRAILISTPEPTSIENTYRFLKALCMRRIKQLIINGNDGELSRSLRSALGMTGSDKAKTLIEIFERLKKYDNGRGRYLDALVGPLDFSLIINQTKNEEDQNMGMQMKQACYDYFKIKMRYLGHVNHSEVVCDAVRKRMPLVTDCNKSETALLMESCLKKMLDVSLP